MIGNTLSNFSIFKQHRPKDILMDRQLLIFHSSTQKYCTNICSENTDFCVSFKVRKRAKIRNRYNQAPHLTNDTNGKETTSQLDITNESQEVENSRWVWSGNTTITNRRQPCGTARKSRSTITRHQEDKLSKATSSLFPIKMIATLEWTYKTYNNYRLPQWELQ